MGQDPNPGGKLILHSAPRLRAAKTISRNLPTFKYAEGLHIFSGFVLALRKDSMAPNVAVPRPRIVQIGFIEYLEKSNLVQIMDFSGGGGD